MKTEHNRGASHYQWIGVGQLRAGDRVELESEQARVIMVEKADPSCVLVAYEGREPVDYPASARLRIRPRA